MLDLLPPVPDGAEPVAHTRNAVGRPLCLLVRLYCPHQALYQLQEACDAKANHRGRGVMNAMDVVEKKNGPRKPRNTTRTWRG